MKREKRLTKRESKALRGPSSAARSAPAAGAAGHDHNKHIHCIACGKHLDPSSFGEPDGAAFTRCDHGSDFPHCIACAEKAKALIVEHDQTGKPVKSAAAWH